MTTVVSAHTSASSPTQSQSRLRKISAWHVLALAAALGTLALAVGPVAETDVFWHVRVGDVLLRHGHFPHVDPWAYTLPGTHWATTEWLSEVVLALAYRIGGFAAISALRLLLVAVLLAVLARQLLPRRTPWIGAIVFTATAMPLAGFDQERPQLASFLFIVWLSGTCVRAARTGETTGLVRVALLTWLWANLHGYWLLAPVALALTAVGILLDSGRGGREAARTLGAAAGAALVAAALTPAGPKLLTSALTVGSAARGAIVEWYPSRLSDRPAAAVTSLLLITLLCWARSRQPIPRSEVLWVVVWLAYALVAIRDLAPAALLLAPVVANRFEWTYGDGRAGPRLHPALAAGGAALGLVAIGLGQSFAPPVDPSKPARIAATLRGATHDLRVLDDYNVSGFLILRAGAHAKLAIDGRADRYGADYISRYLAAEQGKDWRRVVDALRPDVAVLPAELPLVDELLHIRHWRQVQRDGSWILLAAPGESLT